MVELPTQDEEEDSSGNYQLIDDESIRGKVIPPGITSSFTLRPERSKRGKPSER
jgi:hypothetical protein